MASGGYGSTLVVGPPSAAALVQGPDNRERTLILHEVGGVGVWEMWQEERPRSQSVAVLDIWDMGGVLDANLEVAGMNESAASDNSTQSSHIHTASTSAVFSVRFDTWLKTAGVLLFGW
jgi:hypothetical protein